MSDFNINILTPILDINNIESTNENCYLFLMFFLQRSQLITNILRLINSDNVGNHLGVKYLIMNETKFGNIQKKIKEFKKEFEKSELISEILDFIKKTIDNPLLNKKNENNETSLTKLESKQIFFKTRLQTFISSFISISNAVEQIDNSLVLDENDISNYLNSNDKIYIKDECKRKLEKEIVKLELQWIKYKKNPNKNKELYSLLKNWYDL